jgi:lantibiotic modifying enzyme
MIAGAVAERIADPHFIARQVKTEKTGARGVIWDGYSMASGFAGTSLALLEIGRRLSRPELTTQGFVHVREAVANYNLRPGPLGLFTGAAGLLTALDEASLHEPRFRPSALRLHARIVDQIMSLEWDFGSVAPLSPQEYDVVSGLAGIVIALATSSMRNGQSQVAVDHICHFLAWTYQSRGEAAFFQKPSSFPQGAANQALYPEGLTDAGLAHGLAGVLQALCLVQLLTPTTLNLLDPIQRLVDAVYQAGEPITAFVLPEGEDGPLPVPATSPSWCRGRLGTSIGLAWGALATSDRALLAESRALTDAETAEQLDTNCLCHGSAGSLIATSRDERSERRNGLVARLTRNHHPAHAFGFVERSGDTSLNDPSLLSGAAGVALALTSTTGTASSDLPTWLRVLFLAPLESDLN